MMAVAAMEAAMGMIAGIGKKIRREGISIAVRISSSLVEIFSNAE